MDTERIQSELKKLREGRGLRAERMAESPALMEILGLDDPGDAVTALGLLLDGLGDGERVRALKVDFGLELEELLRRVPDPLELDFLGRRRSTYAEVVGRDVKTLGRWSNRALEELQALFVETPFDGHVIVSAGVRSGRLAGIDVITFKREDEERSRGSTHTLTNPDPGPSLPAVIYGLPYGWEPASLTIIVLFSDEVPERAWAVAAGSLSDLCFGHERTELTLGDNVARCRIEEPPVGRVYGIWWG